MTTEEFLIGDRKVGEAHKAFIIAEVAQAHDGSLGYAHSFIDLVAETGADAVKFQTHIAEAETTPLEQWRIKFSYEDDTRYDYWKRMEFTAEQWAGLKKHAEEKGLVFLSSAFSYEAVDLLTRLDMAAWKVASGEVNNFPLLEKMCATGKPLLLSTGMSTTEDIAHQVSFLEARNAPYGLFQCTSKYPTSLDSIGVNVMQDMHKNFSCPVGLSDHSGQIYPGLYAIANGAHLFEAHICFNKLQFGPDTSSSLTPGDFKIIVDARDAFFEMRHNPVDKTSVDENLKTMQKLFYKSVSVRHFLPKGSVLTPDVLTTKKPGVGVLASEIEYFYNKTLNRDFYPTELLSKEDVN